MACAELLMMALLAALKKHNSTSEPIVLWLGNASSPPQVLPWSSVNKSPNEHIKHRLSENIPEKLSSHSRRVHKQTTELTTQQTSNVAPRSHSRSPSLETGHLHKKGTGDYGSPYGNQRTTGSEVIRPHHRRRPLHTIRGEGDDAKKPRYELKQTTAQRAVSQVEQRGKAEGGDEEPEKRHQTSTTPRHQRHLEPDDSHHGHATKYPVKSSAVHHRKADSHKKFGPSENTPSKLNAAHGKPETDKNFDETEPRRKMTRKPDEPDDETEEKEGSTEILPRKKHTRSSTTPKASNEQESRVKDKDVVERDRAHKKHEREHGQPTPRTHEGRTHSASPPASLKRATKTKHSDASKHTRRPEVENEPPTTTSTSKDEAPADSRSKHLNDRSHKPQPSEAPIEQTTEEAKRERRFFLKTSPSKVTTSQPRLEADEKTKVRRKPVHRKFNRYPRRRRLKTRPHPSDPATEEELSEDWPGPRVPKTSLVRRNKPPKRFHKNKKGKTRRSKKQGHVLRTASKTMKSDDKSGEDTVRGVPSRKRMPHRRRNRHRYYHHRRYHRRKHHQKLASRMPPRHLVKQPTRNTARAGRDEKGQVTRPTNEDEGENERPSKVPKSNRRIDDDVFQRKLPAMLRSIPVKSPEEYAGKPSKAGDRD